MTVKHKLLQYLLFHFNLTHQHKFFKLSFFISDKLSKVDAPFYLLDFQHYDNRFSHEFQNLSKFLKMNYTLANQNECLIAKYNSAGNFLDLTAINCSEKHVAICRKVLFVKPRCDGKKSFYGANMIEMMLDSRNNVYNRQVIAYKKAEMKDMMERLN